MRRSVVVAATAGCWLFLSTATLVAQQPLPAASPHPKAADDSKTPPVHVTPENAMTVPSGGRYTFDFQDADIRSVLTALGTAGGVRFMYGDIPSKKVSLHINHPIASGDVPNLMRSVAVANGLKFSTDSDLITITSGDPAPPPRPRTGNLAATNLYVYRLRHANATQLASVLQGIFSVTGSGNVIRPNTSSANEPTGHLSNSPSGMGGGLGGLGGSGGGSGLSGGLGSQTIGGRMSNNNNTAGSPLVMNLSRVLGGGDDEGNAKNAPIIIVPEQSTNALLVRATADDWDIIRETIKSVDLRPMQVVIEVMIAEVSRTDDLKYGVSGNVGKTSGNNTTTANVGPGPDSSSNLLVNFTHGGVVNISAALAALKQRGDVRILSLPLVFAQNNQESSLLVGSEQPYVESYTTSLANTDAQNQVVQYRDVGTLLDILPTINPDGYVNLQVYQEVSSLTNVVQFSAPVINTRQAQASVFVKDGQTIVVGGLTDRQRQDTRSGIPLLSSIPFIGGLFGTTEHTTTRTEIYLFLTPHIVATDEDVDEVRDQVTKHSALLHGIPTDSVRVIDPAAHHWSAPPDTTVSIVPHRSASAVPVVPDDTVPPVTTQRVVPDSTANALIQQLLKKAVAGDSSVHIITSPNVTIDSVTTKSP